MKIEKSWYAQLEHEIQKPYIKELKKFLDSEKQEQKIIYPPEDLIFNAFLHTPFDSVKVVIVGQDPYHGKGQAHGLAFSVPPETKIPFSLKNIFKEIKADLNIPISSQGCLIPWAKQGVFLLNATLTVRAGEPKSHYGKGWEQFTDAVIEVLASRKDPLVFLLWGQSAKEKCIKLRDYPHHMIFQSAHPSPYSAEGFFGCRHFSKTNEFLEKIGKEAIDWNVDKKVLINI